jgi:hypothetical protein
MNERCSWCSREGGLGNGSRSSSPDLAAIRNGLNLTLFSGLEKHKITKKNKTLFSSCMFIKVLSQRPESSCIPDQLKKIIQ